MAVNEQGHKGQYSGNSRHSYNHAHTKVTRNNYGATVKDDLAHMHYLKMDIMYDDHHGHSDEKMTADEKHISKLAGDLKYDKEHHGPSKELTPAQEAAFGGGKNPGLEAAIEAAPGKYEGAAKISPERLEKIAGQLRQASAMHKGQAQKIDNMLKSTK